MRRQQNYEQRIAVLEAQLATVRQERSAPRVGGLWSGLVTAAPGAILAGATLVLTPPISVMGGWGASAAFNMPQEACVQFGGLLVVAGSGVAVLAIGADVINFAEIGTAFVNRFFDYWEGRRDKPQSPQVQERLVPYRQRDQAAKQWDYYSTEYADHSIIIREETDKQDALKWTYAQLWYFIEDCFRTGEWSRRKVCERWGADMSQSQHKAIQDFLNEKAPGLWGLKGERNRPTLEAWLRRFRWTPANQPTSQPTNQEQGA